LSGNRQCFAMLEPLFCPCHRHCFLQCVWQRCSEKSDTETPESSIPPIFCRRVRRRVVRNYWYRGRWGEGEKRFFFCLGAVLAARFDGAGTSRNWRCRTGRCCSQQRNVGGLPSVPTQPSNSGLKSSCTLALGKKNCMFCI
jgi:hypothetical protein